MLQYAPPHKADLWHGPATSGRPHFHPPHRLSPHPYLCESASISPSSPQTKWASPSASSSSLISAPIPAPVLNHYFSIPKSFSFPPIFPNTMSSLPPSHFLNFDIHPTHLDLHLERLTSTTDSTSTSFTAQELVNYGHFRYHILVSYDPQTPDSTPEKALLQACQSALRHDFHDIEGRADAVSASFQAFDNWWEDILKSDYILRSNVQGEGGAPETTSSGNGAAARTLVKLRIFTAADGHIQTTSHNEEIQWPRHNPIRNLWSQIPVFRGEQIRIVGRRERRLGVPAMVVVGRGGGGTGGGARERSGDLCHLISLQQALQPDYFANMINSHVKVLGESSFAQIVGLRESEDGAGIDGVFRRTLRGGFLDEVMEGSVGVSREMKRKWKLQIEEAVKRGAQLGLQLEDLSPRDVFVTEDGMDVVVYGLGTPTRGGGRPLITGQTGRIRGGSPIMRYLDESM